MVDGGSGIPRGKGEKATSPTEHQQGSSALGALAAAAAPAGRLLEKRGAGWAALLSSGSLDRSLGTGVGASHPRGEPAPFCGSFSDLVLSKAFLQ